MEAQYKAVPPNRPRPDLESIRNDSNTRKAAVMALINPIGDVPHLALIKRVEYPGVHGGQISFPGGKSEKIDSDLLQTAYRETTEEIGVPKHHYRVWKPLTEVYIPPSRFLVQPYVGIAEKELQFVAEEREVEDILQVPVEWLCQEDVMTTQEINMGGFVIKVPTFTFGDHIIWGATAMMISELAELLRRVERL